MDLSRTDGPAGDRWQVSPDRVRLLHDAPIRSGGRLVLYWMTAARRSTYSHALQRSVAWARQLRRPLVVLEPLTLDTRRASDRLHRFTLQGMADNQAAFRDSPVVYWPHVETEPGESAALVAALAAHAALVVLDDHPSSPGFGGAAEFPFGQGVRVEAVDSNGLIPMRAVDRAYARAVDFRRFVQRTLPVSFEPPLVDPVAGADLEAGVDLPEGLLSRHHGDANRALLAVDVRDLRIDHDIAPAPLVGGPDAGRRRLLTFVSEDLCRYAESSRQLHPAVQSGLSPYLSFGHVSAHEIFASVADNERWSPLRTAEDARGRRAGWWGMSEGAEAFLDQLVVWREIGFNAATWLPDHDRYESLPAWAQETLADHVDDVRPAVYDLETLAAGRTHDALWNAAQRQLVEEGAMPGYLRMLWGKKVLRWSPDPRQALHTLVELNDRHALAGRDPNAISGIFWVFGRYDRPWFPERPVLGRVRYMSTRSAMRKLRGVRDYIERYTPGEDSAAVT